jgi:RNA polymerase II-associated factor 1
MNKLPELPYDPKFLKCPLDENRYYTYRETSLEREYKYEMLTGIDVGVNLDLIDISSFAVPENPPPLDPVDQQLIEAASKTTLKQVTTPAAFLLHPQYLSIEERATSGLASSAALMNTKEKEENLPFEDEKSKLIQSILETFEAAKALPVHPTNPKIKPMEILPLLPDEELWGNEYSEVVFDTDPASEEVGSKRKNAIIKSFSMAGHDATGLKYFLPKRRRISSIHLDDSEDPEQPDPESDLPPAEDLAEDESEYEWVREFKYRLIKAEGENFLFVWKKDMITYTEIKSKILMQKVTTDTEHPRSTRLIVKKLPELSPSARLQLDTAKQILNDQEEPQ